MDQFSEVCRNGWSSEYNIILVYKNHESVKQSHRVKVYSVHNIFRIEKPRITLMNQILGFHWLERNSNQHLPHNLPKILDTPTPPSEVSFGWRDKEVLQPTFLVMSTSKHRIVSLILFVLTTTYSLF